MIARPSVVLPQPLSPTRPTVSPGLMKRLTSSTARTKSLARLKTPCFTGKRTLRLRTSRRFMGWFRTGRVLSFAVPVRAARGATRDNFPQHRRINGAVGLGLRATGMKAAAPREASRLRDVAGDPNQATGWGAEAGH